MPALFGIILVFMMPSCSDEPVMTLPAVEDLDGVWECQGFSKQTKVAMGNEIKPGNLVLRRDGAYRVQNCPVSDPLRMIEKSGRWDLLDPTITPSGVSSVELNGTFYHSTTEEIS